MIRPLPSPFHCVRIAVPVVFAIGALAASVSAEDEATPSASERLESDSAPGVAGNAAPAVLANTTESLIEPTPLAAGRHPAIRVGESLVFDVRWGIVPAGTATLSITEERAVGGHPCYHVVATAISNPVFDKIYPVRDQFESFMDAGDLRSWAFKKHLREGKFRRDQVVQKDHAAGKAYYHDGEVHDLTPGAYDVLSAFYFVRTLPLLTGERYALESHTDRKNYPIQVTVHRRERVTVPAGSFDCVVVEPTLQSGDFFKNEGSLLIWLTDDDRRIPVQMKSKIPVGSIDVMLQTYERPAPASSGMAREPEWGREPDRGETVRDAEEENP